jgi:hypothetical protein
MINLNFLNINLSKNVFGEKNKFNKTIKRFIEIFEFHGIRKEQIPQIFSEIRLKDLSSDEAILSVLNNDIIQKTSDLFQINREWIEGETKKIYRTQTYYKNPELFFEKLKRIDYKDTFNSILIFSSETKLDFSSSKNQPIALVLREKIKDIGGKEIFRYYISGDGWNWKNKRGRLQLKAMAKISYEKFKIDIPIYQTSSRNINKTRKGEIVPSFYSIKSKTTTLSLENFSLPPEYYYESREKEELFEVEKNARNILKSI